MKTKVLVVTDSMHIGCGVREVVLVLIRVLMQAGYDLSFLGAGYNPPEIAPEFCGVKSYMLHSCCISQVGMRTSLFFLPWVFARIALETTKAELIIIESNSVTGIIAILCAKIYNAFALILRLKRKKLLFHAHTQADEYIKHISLFNRLFGKIQFVPIIKLVIISDWLLSRFLGWVANSAIRGFMNQSNSTMVPTEYFAELIEKRYKGRWFQLRNRPEAWTAPLSIPKGMKEYDILELYLRQGEFTRVIPLTWPILVYIGRIGKEKGTEQLLELFGQLHLLNQKVGLVVIGGGDVERYRQLADNLPANAGQYVSFFGRVSHDESIALNAAGGGEDLEKIIGISCSDTETQGIAIHEQLGLGHPVITKEHSCFERDIKKCNGGILISDNIERSAHEVADFLNDPQKRKRCGQNGQAYIQNILNEEKCAEELLRICSKTLGEEAVSSSGKKANTTACPRVGFLVEFFDPTISGVVVSVYTMAKHFLGVCYSVPIVFAPRVLHKDTAPFQVVRLPSIPLGLHTAIALPFLWPGLLCKISRLNLDLIHLQSAYTLGLLGVRLKKSLGIPFVVHFHTDIVETSQCFLGKLRWLFGRLVRLASLYLVNQLFGNADHIIVPSSYTKRSLIKYGIDPSRMTVVPTPVKAPKKWMTRLEARKKVGLPRYKLILLFVGRMSTDKNLEMLLKAFQIVAKSRRDANLVLVGGGLYSWKLRYLAWRMGIRNKIIFVGPVPYENIYYYYFACDIFTFSGFCESQGLAPLEALAVEKPVVAVKSGGVSEYIRHEEHGLLVENDPGKFAEATLKLANDPDLRQLYGENGAEYVRTELSAEVVYQSLYDVYEKVLARKG